jgi:hypothetical protein
MLVFPTRALPLWQYTDNTKGIKPNRVPGIPGDSKDNLDCKSDGGSRPRYFA